MRACGTGAPGFQMQGAGFRGWGWALRVWGLGAGM